MHVNIETNKHIPLRWEGNDYFIENATIVENYPLIDISPFDPELSKQLQQHMLENQTLKLEMRDGYYVLPIACSPHSINAGKEDEYQ